jgi:hypothetical protein
VLELLVVLVCNVDDDAVDSLTLLARELAMKSEMERS